MSDTDHDNDHEAPGLLARGKSPTPHDVSKKKSSERGLHPQYGEDGDPKIMAQATRRPRLFDDFPVETD